MKVKKTIVKKYSEGTASVEAKPKKMNFFKRLKAKEDESAKLAQSIDAQDSTPKQEYNITQEKSFVGPKNANLEGRSAEVEYTNAKRNKEGREAEANYAAGKPSSVAKTAPSASSTTTGLAKGGTQAVADWQKKRGLKADGAWGKDTQAAYEKEQAVKKMKLNKTKPVQNSIKSTSKPEEQVKSSTHKPAYATGQKGKDGVVYFSNGRTYNPKTGEKGTVGDGSVYLDKDKTKRAANADMNAWGNATNKNKPAQRNEEERVKAAEVISRRYEDPELRGSGGFAIPEKQTKEIVDIERKGNDAVMSTASKAGLGAGAIAALTTAVYGYKKGRKTDLVNNLTEAALDKAKSNKATTNKFNKLAEANKAIDESYEAPVKKMKLKKAEKTEAPATNSGSTSSTATNTTTETYQQKRIRLAEERAANAAKTGNNGKGTQPKAGSKYATPEETEYMKAKGTTKRPTAEELKAYLDSKGGVAASTKEAAKTEVKSARQPRVKKAESTSAEATTKRGSVPPKPATSKPDAEVKAALDKKTASAVKKK